MKKIIFITGSVRSGKSSYAVELATHSSKNVIFLATCKPEDAEMIARVAKHKKERLSSWTTVEEQHDVEKVIRDLYSDDIVILDCLTLWITNLLTSGCEENEVFRRVDSFICALKETKGAVIIVSNEVGWGIVPENKLARLFRDIIGAVHQKICATSDEVYLMVGGIAMEVKK